MPQKKTDTPAAAAPAQDTARPRLRKAAFPKLDAVSLQTATAAKPIKAAPAKNTKPAAKPAKSKIPVVKTQSAKTAVLAAGASPKLDVIETPALVSNAVAYPIRPRTKHTSRTPLLSAEIPASITAVNITGEAIAGETIARRAYFIWLEQGCPEGSADADWLAAEKELLALS